MMAAPKTAPLAASSNRKAYYFYALSAAVALVVSAVLVAVISNAQAVEPKAPAAASASMPPVAASTVRYSAKDINRAFNFMDANHDGIISRDEAAGFRAVARHFDAADTNKDNALSPTEFSTALNRP